MSSDEKFYPSGYPAYALSFLSKPMKKCFERHQLAGSIQKKSHED